MTKIEINKRGRHYSIEAINHAGTSRVCAAVSALLCTLEGALTNNSSARNLVTQKGPAYYAIDCDAMGRTVREDWRFLTIGLLQIEKANPGEIAVAQNIFL